MNPHAKTDTRNYLPAVDRWTPKVIAGNCT